jgi:hypothetical protein
MGSSSFAGFRGSAYTRAAKAARSGINVEIAVELGELSALLPFAKPLFCAIKASISAFVGTVAASPALGGIGSCRGLGTVRRDQLNPRALTLPLADGVHASASNFRFSLKGEVMKPWPCSLSHPG